MSLVQEYIGQHSEVAFAELVRRHINLVYSVALRFTDNSPDAEDIAQAVFIILAKKAAGLRASTVLTGWLYETTRLTALQFLRTRNRRHYHEQEAYVQSTLENSEADALWVQLKPLLENAMSQLNEKERTLLALRFFENRTGTESAAILGLGEWAARKRAARALEKLRNYFSRHGVNSTTTILEQTISANSIQAAPSALAKSVAVAAIAKGGAASASTLTLIQGALKLMAWTKAKTAAAAGLAAILVIGGTTFVVEVCLPAPEVQGMWQATLPLVGGYGVKAGESPKTRLVLKIVKTNGEYQATGDSIDQGYKDVPISVLDYKYPHLHVEVTDSSFDGTINRWGTKISGKWKENSASGPLVWTRTTQPPTFPEPLADEEFAPRADSDLQGFWKGNIKTGKSGLEVNIKIAEPSHGTFRADFYCPPQGGGRQPATVSYDGTTIKLMPMAGYGMFEGQLRNGGKEMVGKWIQNGRQIPTTFALAN